VAFWLSACPRRSSFAVYARARPFCVSGRATATSISESIRQAASNYENEATSISIFNKGRFKRCDKPGHPERKYATMGTSVKTNRTLSCAKMQRVSRPQEKRSSKWYTSALRPDTINGGRRHVMQQSLSSVKQNALDIERCQALIAAAASSRWSRQLSATL